MNNILYEFIKLKTYIQLFHWSTTSYEHHIAAGNLYSKLDTSIDKFVEIASRNKRLTIDKPLQIKHITNAILLKTISQFVKFFEKQNLDPDLDNIRDEILGDIHQT